MPKHLTVRLAQSKDEFEEAYRLLAKSRSHWDPVASDLWLLKQHALPSTTTFVAIKGEEILGAICLFGENPFLLPVEEKANLSGFKAETHGRLAEISFPGLAEENDEILHALFHFATNFGANFCHFESFVFSGPKDWTDKYCARLGFQKLSLKENQSVFHLNPNELTEFKSEEEIHFHYPEKKFFLVAHQSMRPDVLHYLFNQRTQLFQSLSDLEWRVLKNIYDYGEYAKALPERELKPSASPKSRRFPMNCQGELKRANGEKINLVVLDVSREGIKLKTEEPMKKGEVCALTISIGVMKRTELIANVVWVDDFNQVAGFEVKSGDKNWAKLIEYLEKDFLLCA